MTAPAPDLRLVLARLTAAIARVVPSEAAVDQASLEWRCIRIVWLEAIAAVGFTEDQTREIARASFDQGLAKLFEINPPQGRA